MLQTTTLALCRFLSVVCVFIKLHVRKYNSMRELLKSFCRKEKKNKTHSSSQHIVFLAKSPLHHSLCFYFYGIYTLHVPLLYESLSVSWLSLASFQ